MAYPGYLFGGDMRSCREALLHHTIKPVEQLVSEYQNGGHPVLSARRLEFTGTNGRDVYNQTALFTASLGGAPTEIKLGRVEPRANHDSEVWVFKHTGNGVYEPVPSIKHFKGEDPFYQFIAGELFVGFVETFTRTGTGHLGYRTSFYRDHHLGIDHLTHFAYGPDGMKDIRFAQLTDGDDKGKIRLVSRPQNMDVALGGRGKNAAINLDSIDDLDAAAILKSRIVQGQLPDTQWIGTNQIFPLTNGDVAYLSHVARFVSENEGDGLREYFISMYSDRFPEPRIILIRNDIEQSMDPVMRRHGYKRVDLINVLFAGGLRRLPGGNAVLDVGAGDAEAWEVTIPDPILWYESKSKAN